jgi:mRNA-degrading endonuclease YafQ of YafQ-DinJ toxin-antitoxin module
MTNPNEALGQWILRDILKLNEGELLTYQKLEDIGLDAVVIYKIDEYNFQIDFAKIGSYDSFAEEN